MPQPLFTNSNPYFSHSEADIKHTFEEDTLIKQQPSMQTIKKILGRKSNTPPSESTSSALVQTPAADIAQTPSRSQPSIPEASSLSTAGPGGIKTVSDPSNPSL